MHHYCKSALRTFLHVCLAVTGGVVASAANADCVDSNTCFGVGALGANVAGNENSAFGAGALEFQVQENGNTAIGFHVLQLNTDGAYNTAVGRFAMRLNTAGDFNAALGERSLHENTTGDFNTAAGSAALGSNRTGTLNTAIGSAALLANISGSRNTASGASALLHNKGSNNTAHGFEALTGTTGGNRNTAVGVKALDANTTGSANTSIGADALGKNVIGIRNVALGDHAGFSVTGSDNITLGAGTQGVQTENGVIRIGSAAYQKKSFIAGIRGVQIDSTTAAPVLIDANGQLGTVQSSMTVKEDIQPMSSISERLLLLRPVTFRYKVADENGSKPLQFGLIAEEVAHAFPELVVRDPQGKPETVRYHLLATLLLNEVQEQHGLIGTQASRIAELEKQAAQLARLKKEVATMAEVIARLDQARMVATTH